MRSWILILFNLLFCFASKAEESPYQILDSSYFFEHDSTLDISYIISNDSIFKPLSHYKEKIRHTYFLNYWTKVELINNTHNEDLAYRTVALWANRVQIYQYDLSGKIYRQEAGIFLKKQEGGILSGPFIIFRIPYSSGKITFYLHHLGAEARPGPIIEGTFDHIIRENNFFYSASWFILTTLLIVFLLALSLFITSSDKLYLFYTLHVFFVGMFSMMDFGLIIKMLGFRPPYLVYLNMYTLSFVGSIIALMFYTRSFLNTKEKMPAADKVILILVACRILLFIISHIPAQHRVSWFLRLNSTYWDMPLIGYALSLGIYSIVRKHRYAWLFSGSFLVLFMSVLIPHIWVTQMVQINMPYLSLVLLETLLFFIAIIFRIKVLNKEREYALVQSINLKDELIGQMKEYDLLKDKVNRELEQKVEERTDEIKKKNQQIEQMNLLLQQHNIELKEDVENLEKARLLQQVITFEEFKKKYPDDKVCFSFLSGLKWPNEFACRKCGNSRYSIHDEYERRKCSKCNYIESPASDTIFHNVKFPIHKAFYLLYLFSSGKNPSFEQLSKTLNLRMATIWSFKQRVELAINNKKAFRKSNEGWTQLIFLEKK